MVSMNRYRLAIPYLVLTLAVSAAFAAPPVPTAPGTPAEWATIVGRVTDVHGKPITSAVVILSKTGEETTTDDNGNYIFTGEPAGAYLIRVQAKFYQTVSFRLEVQAGVTNRLDAAIVSISKKGHASHVVPSLKSGLAIISVITSQGHRLSPPDPIANGPLNPFQGDLGLHSTARSR